VVNGVSLIALPNSDLASSDLGDPMRGVGPLPTASPLPTGVVSTGTVPEFVAGPENRLAVPAIEQLLAGNDLSSAADLFNPLVLLGSTGTGKSHLARGITRHWQGLFQKQALFQKQGLGGSEVAQSQVAHFQVAHSQIEYQIEYLTAIDFARQLRAAREEGQLDRFRDRLANLRLLVLEDLQRLPLRTFVQRELRDTFDVLIEAGAVVVITTGQPPAAMTGLEAGLRDRLSSGLTVRLQTPGIEARRTLLQLSATKRGLQLDEEQLSQMAHKVEGPASQLFRAIAEYSLAEAWPAKRPTGLTRPPLEFKQILAVVARYYSLTQAAMRSAARRKSLVYARSIAIHLARTLTDQSYAQIGESLGRRDHTTIMHASRTIEKRLTNDASTQQDIEELKRNGF